MDQEFVDLSPVANDSLGGNLRCTFVSEDGSLLTLTFTTPKALIDFMQMVTDGASMMAGTKIWPTRLKPN